MSLQKIQFSCKKEKKKNKNSNFDVYDYTYFWVSRYTHLIDLVLRHEFANLSSLIGTKSIQKTGAEHYPDLEEIDSGHLTLMPSRRSRGSRGSISKRTKASYGFYVWNHKTSKKEKSSDPSVFTHITKEKHVFSNSVKHNITIDNIDELDLNELDLDVLSKILESDSYCDKELHTIMSWALAAVKGFESYKLFHSIQLIDSEEHSIFIQGNANS